MSSDLYVFDGSFYRHSSPHMVPSDTTDLQFLSDPFSPFSADSPIDILQAISDLPNQQNSVDETHSLDQFAPGFLSSSPPSHQLESLSLYQTTQLQSLANASNLENGYVDFSGLEAKSEECQVGFESSYSQTCIPHSYSGAENVAKYMQRSYSSNSFEKRSGFCFQPRFDSLMESPNYQTHVSSSPEYSFSNGNMRRVCSTGDLQNIRTVHATQGSFSRPLATESLFMEDASLRVGRYSAEERKERILKYRAKRTQRNFNKTIKYACRKTLADNRPRIRGRFARNDETGEIPKAACSTRDEDEDELWLDGSHEEEEDGTVRGQFVINSFGQTQFQYYGF